jgi:hypothetical protein
MRFELIPFGQSERVTDWGANKCCIPNSSGHGELILSFGLQLFEPLRPLSSRFDSSFGLNE